jgi:hypothetical protein
MHDANIANSRLQSKGQVGASTDKQIEKIAAKGYERAKGRGYWSGLILGVRQRAAG